MNKCWYASGNSIKVMAREEHRCYMCGNELEIFTHHRIVERDSEEAKYFRRTRIVGHTIMFLPCEFIHKAFYCPHCDKAIEYRTQLGMEDVDIDVAQTVRYFDNKGRNIQIYKIYRTVGGKLVDRIEDISQIQSLHLSVAENGRHLTTYVLPIERWFENEREYYFRLSKRKLIRHIKKSESPQNPED